MIFLYVLLSNNSNYLNYYSQLNITEDSSNIVNDKLFVYYYGGGDYCL